MAKGVIVRIGVDTDTDAEAIRVIADRLVKVLNAWSREPQSKLRGYEFFWVGVQSMDGASFGMSRWLIDAIDALDAERRP